MAQNGQETLIVVEPIKEKGAATVWGYFVFALPAVKQLMMTPAVRWTETARLVGPISALVFIAVWWLLRSSTISIKRQSHRHSQTPRKVNWLDRPQLA